MNTTLVAFDLECTGLSPRTDEVIEIGAVRFDRAGATLAEFNMLVEPGVPLPVAIQRLTGITSRDLRGAPSPVEAVAELADFAAGTDLIAHGAQFDLAFCARLAPSAFRHRQTIDTLDLARILMPMVPSHSLPLLSAELGLTHDRPHRALSDARATRDLYLHLCALAAALPPALLAEIRQIVAQAPGALCSFFTDITDVPASTGGLGPAGGRVLHPPVPNVPRDTVAATAPESAHAPASATAPESAHAPASVHAPAFGNAPASPAIPSASFIPPVPNDSDGSLEVAVAHLLGPAGPLGADPGYEYRDTQIEMGRAVAQTLERGRRLLVEAGTGVGKSLAYLVPLAVWIRRGQGRRAVVATYTVPLQEQIMSRDASLISRLVGPEITIAMLKGRAHYLSPRRWRRYLRRSDVDAHGRADLDAIRFKLKLLVWLQQTTTGDRAELRLAGPEELLWRNVESDAIDCLGGACTDCGPARCYASAARLAAASADLVITNQALLFADADRGGDVLGVFQALVVDEAHHLDGAATAQMGVQLTAIDMVLLMERIPERLVNVAEAELEQCRDGLTRLFGDVKGLIGELLGRDHPGNGVVALTDAVRDLPRFQAVHRTATVVAARLGDAARAASAEETDAEAVMIAAALRSTATAIRRVLDGPTADDVTWIELRAEQAELHAAPTSVTAALGERLFDPRDATILTSATLTVGDSFDHIRHRLGFEARAEELQLASPFDFVAQALCVLPTDIPPYDAAGYDVALAGLVAEVARRLGGRTLVLFTGYSSLRRAHGLLTTQLDGTGIAVLGQSLDGTRRQLIRDFKSNPRTVLLGTSSFWEGIDVPGDALRCVVIAKLPFPVPTDPLVRARTEHLSDPFGQYVLPQAVLRLKQGFGRLIRTGTDRGAVVIGDSRLDRRDYGNRFLAALPPAAVARVPVAAVGAAVDDFVSGSAAGSALPAQSAVWHPPQSPA